MINQAPSDTSPTTLPEQHAATGDNKLGEPATKTDDVELKKPSLEAVDERKALKTYSRAKLASIDKKLQERREWFLYGKGQEPGPITRTELRRRYENNSKLFVIDGETRKPEDGEVERRLKHNLLWWQTKGKMGEPADFIMIDLTDDKDSLKGKNLTEADLRGADLYGMRFCRTNFWQADLQGAKLILADFEAAKHSSGDAGPYDPAPPDPRSADLSGANLRQATLGEAKLATVQGLRAQHLGGTDLTNAKLSDEIKKFDTLPHVEKTSQNASATFFTLLAACLYSGLVIAGTGDVELVTNGVSSPLPIINTAVSTDIFYLTAPFILLCMYVYLHLYLMRLWRDLSALPAIFPDGETISERAYPWILNSLIKDHSSRLSKNKRPLQRLEKYVSVFLAWAVVPVILFFFWARYLPSRSWIATGFQATFVVLAVLFGFHTYRLAIDTLKGKDLKDLPNDALALVAAITTAAVLGSASAGAAFDPKGIHWLTGIPAWGFSLVYRNLPANLEDQAISGKPPSWAGPEQLTAADLEQIKGADLRDKDLRHMSATHAFLVKAKLRKANLDGARLDGADLRYADLSDAHLKGANLTKAKLQGANLVKAKLHGANLSGVDLRAVQHAGAMPFGAELVGACANEETKPEHLQDLLVSCAKF